MAINFPSSPYVGQIYTYNGRSWEWNGTYWESYTFPSSGLTGATSVGVGDSVISNIVDNVLELKSFSGDGITIIDDGDTLTFSASTPPGGAVTSVSGGTGLSGNSTTGAVVLVNTAPDQTVTITGGTNLQINGTYPNFGIDFTGQTSFEYLPLSGGTVTGNTTFTSGLTVNYIDFDTTPNVPAPTGGTLFFDSNNNALSYKPITNNNDVTINIGYEDVIRIYNNTGTQINNGKALTITGSTSGVPTVALAIASGGNNVDYQVDGVATHDIPDGEYGIMTQFGVVRDLNLTSFSNGEDIFLSQTVPGNFDSYSNLSFTGRTIQIGHVNDNSSSGELQLNIQNESLISLVTDRENSILNGNNSSTGVFEFSGLTIDTPSGSTFSVAPVKGWIVDNTTNPVNPSVQYVEFSGQNGIQSLYFSSDTITYILLTSGLTITQQTTIPTPIQRRQNIYLGKFGHGNRQFLINAFTEPDLDISPISQLRDIFTPIRLINDGVIPSPNGVNLSFNTSSGYLWGLGINFKNSVLNPTRLTVNSQSPATFQYRTQTGGTAVNTTFIDPLNYDLNGIITPLVGNKSTNQRIYLLQNGQVRAQYGQNIYNTLSSAISAVQTESFVTFPNFRDNAILIGILSISTSCTDLSDTSKAQFFITSKFGETVGAAGGSSTTTLQQAYNNSSEPEILINSTLDGVSIRNGTGNADNVTSLLQGQNTAGSVTSFIRADGLFSGSSVSTPGFTATTSGLTAFEFIVPEYYSNIDPYYNLVRFDGDSLVKPLSNEGFGGKANSISGDWFINIDNNLDSRAIEIFYTLRSTNDDNFRSGKIIANWDSSYTNFYQNEYGPNYDLTTMTFIDPPQVVYGGTGTSIRVVINFDDVTDPLNLLTARFKYVLI